MGNSNGNINNNLALRANKEIFDKIFENFNSKFNRMYFPYLFVCIDGMGPLASSNNPTAASNVPSNAKNKNAKTLNCVNANMRKYETNDFL